MELYIVRSNDPLNDNLDCFASYELAKEWADYIGGSLVEEPIIDRETLDAMIYEYSTEEDN